MPIKLRGGQGNLLQTVQQFSPHVGVLQGKKVYLSIKQNNF